MSTAATPKIRIYGGANEIGGNQILIETDKARILLDFGTRMGFESEFFGEFLDTRSNTSLKDRITIGALPKIPGIYWELLIRPDGYDTLKPSMGRRVLTKDSPLFELDDVETYAEYEERTGRPFVNVLFLTHAHLDHCGYIGYLDPAIELRCSKVTKVLLEAIDSVTTMKTEALTTGAPSIAFNKGGLFPGSPKLEKEKVSRKCTTMDDEETVKVGDMEVTMIEVDHSVPGAASFLVEAGSKTILYTGDFRFHGTRSMTMEDYVEKVGKVDAMICEGTRVDSATPVKESEVGDKIYDQIKDAKGLVFIDFSWKDTTRYETVKKAVDKTKNRTLVINGRLAYLLKALGMYPSKTDRVKVFLKRRVSGLYSPADYSKSKHEFGLSTDWDADIDSTHYENGVDAEELMKHPEKYVVMLSYYDLGQVFDILDDDGKVPGSVFIKAQCEPFSEEMELNEERLINWLVKFGISYIPCPPAVPAGCGNPGCDRLHERLDRAHASGHASRPELKELIKLIKPKILIPVHTEDAKEFAAIVKELEKEEGLKIVLRLPRNGDEIKVDL